jgi:hypothetical protein
MCARIRWSRVALLASTLLTLTVAASCAAHRAPDLRHDDLDHSSMVRGHACDRSDQDTTHYLHLPLYHACAVTVAARRVANDLQPDFYPGGRDRSCFTALIELAVDTLGRPEMRSVRLVRASDPGFGAALLAVVPGLRFEPARLGDRRVRQIYEMREQLLVRRGRGLEATAGPRQAMGGARGSGRGPVGASSSEAPTGVELPTASRVGAC